MKVTAPRDGNSSRTLRRRVQEVDTVREIVSGGQPEQLLQIEIHHLSPTQRRELLIKAGVKIEIPAEQGLAMKTNMATTWKGMREIPEMVDECRKVYETHKMSLTLFGRCHHIYDRNIIPSEKLSELGKYNIHMPHEYKNFIAIFYRDRYVRVDETLQADL